jgi:hypothetical protein
MSIRFSNGFLRATAAILLFGIMAGMGCASDHQEVQAPPTSVLNALNKVCVNDLGWGYVSDPQVWCAVQFQIVDGDHGSVPFGTGSSPGTVCDGSYITAPAGPIGLTADNAGGYPGWNTEWLPITSSPCGFSIPGNKIQLDATGKSGAYGCGTFCMDPSAISSLQLAQSVFNNTLYVQGDPRCSGAAGGSVIQYTIMTDSKHLSISYLGCSTHSEGGGKTFITWGTILFTAEAYATKSFGHTTCTSVDCN